MAAAAAAAAASRTELKEELLARELTKSKVARDSCA